MAEEVLEPGPTTSTVDTTSRVTSVEQPKTWLHINLRPLVVVLFVVMACYLAYLDEPGARASIVVTATSLVSYLFGERTALKSPGKDTS